MVDTLCSVQHLHLQSVAKMLGFLKLTRTEICYGTEPMGEQATNSAYIFFRLAMEDTHFAAQKIHLALAVRMFGLLRLMRREICCGKEPGEDQITRTRIVCFR